MVNRIFMIALCLHFCQMGFAQGIPYHISNSHVYDLLDELANMKVIEVNSCVKPYSRRSIAVWLLEAKQRSEELTNRQQKEVDFYLKDFGKELDGMTGQNHVFRQMAGFMGGDPGIGNRLDFYYHKDSLFTLTINPIGGATVYHNANGKVLHRWMGGEVNASIGKNWSFYANLRDNNETERLAGPSYLTNHESASIKDIDRLTDREGIDWSEMRGGMVYDWQWGSLGLVKDHFAWGNNQNGANIFSGHTPSFALIKMNISPVKWFDFNYVHGWLSSRIIDSVFTYSYGSVDRSVFVGKYLSANLLTVAPFSNLHVSLGNSVIYSEKDYAHYLIPVLFYKSVDHGFTMNNNFGTNAQMFMDVSSRQIKHLHLYTTLFVDEISFSRMWDPKAQSNFISWKAGGTISNPFRSDLSLTAEFTRTNPLTFQHFIPTTTFASSDYNLGHYLLDNAREVHMALRYKPTRSLSFRASYTFAQRGDEYIYGDKSSYGIHKDTGPWGIPFMENVTWESSMAVIGADWQITHDMFVKLAYQVSNTSGNVQYRTAPYFHGKQNTIIVGFNYGL